MVAHTGFLTARPPAGTTIRESRPGASERTRPRRHRTRDRRAMSAAGDSASSRACSRGPASSSASRSASTSSRTVVTPFGGSRPDDRVGVAVLFLVLVGVDRAGVRPRARRSSCTASLPMPDPLPMWDRIAGAAVGAFGLLVLLWMVIPSFATAKGWPARMARELVDGRRDPAVGAAASPTASRRGVAPSPTRRSRRRSARCSRRPNPGSAARHDDHARGRPRACASSIVKVTGHACDQIQDGSGWVAAPGVVVTNAHVVAGERATTVHDAPGARCPRSSSRSTRCATSRCSPSRRSPARPLPIATGAVGDVGAVYGHPGGGPLQASPARIGDEILAVGTDIYRTGRAGGTCTCSRRSSRPATPAARS